MSASVLVLGVGSRDWGSGIRDPGPKTRDRDIRRSLETETIWRLLPILVLSVAACSVDADPALPPGAPAPDFALPGVDGKIHRLGDYASSPVLAVVFTCNHCPVSQLYESRIKRLYEDY